MVLQDKVLHETFNMAMNWKLPVVFVVENNQYAMGTSVKRTANHEDIYKLGLGYEMPCLAVDAMDPVKVAEAAYEAIERARRGDGPTFIEARTYRYRGHSMSDAEPYRSKEEVAVHKNDDPIELVKHRILENGWATERNWKLSITNPETLLKSASNSWKTLHIRMLRKSMSMYMLRKIIHS
jgi:pyruvate dehydrogenase E1 component alpha subunit